MIMTSSVSIVISDYIIPVIQMSLYTTLLFVTFIVHYIMMTSHVKNKTTGGGGHFKWVVRISGDDITSCEQMQR